MKLAETEAEAEAEVQVPQQWQRHLVAISSSLSSSGSPVSWNFHRQLQLLQRRSAAAQAIRLRLFQPLRQCFGTEAMAALSNDHNNLHLSVGLVFISHARFLAEFMHGVFLFQPSDLRKQVPLI